MMTEHEKLVRAEIRRLKTLMTANDAFRAIALKRVSAAVEARERAARDG